MDGDGRFTEVGRAHRERRARTAGPEMLPYPGPARPSFPAGATTSVSSRSAPATARAEGLSSKAANGSATPTSATLAASSATPSAFGSTTLEPSDELIGPSKTAQRPPASRCQPAARIGRIALRRGRFHSCQLAPRNRPSGPPSASRAARGAGRVLGSRSQPNQHRRRRRRLSCVTCPSRYGCLDSTPVSRRAMVTPRPSKPGRTTSGREPEPVAAFRSRSASRTRRPDRRCGPDRRRRPRAPARGGPRRGGRAARRSRSARGHTGARGGSSSLLRETGDQLVVRRKGRSDPLPLLRFARCSARDEARSERDGLLRTTITRWPTATC